jgi:ubiquinone/menaquinone biosynthesis C-methylase UbiE
MIDSAFAEAAPYYKHRAPYAPATFEYLLEQARLNSRSRVLDLGSGPGTIAIPLSRTVDSVLAVDPSPEMIDEGRARAAAADCHTIDWLCTSAEEMDEARGLFDLAVIGQAFHWMDRDMVLRKVARMLTSNGALALVDRGKRRPQESWELLSNQLVERYLGKRARHPKMSGELPHEVALQRSACFVNFTSREFAIEFERDIPSIIAFIYSTSTSPKSAFGTQASDFERELSAELLTLNPTGVFKEETETEVIFARCARRS